MPTEVKPVSKVTSGRAAAKQSATTAMPSGKAANNVRLAAEDANLGGPKAQRCISAVPNPSMEGAFGAARVGARRGYCSAGMKKNMTPEEIAAICKPYVKKTRKESWPLFIVLAPFRLLFGGAEFLGAAMHGQDAALAFKEEVKPGTRLWPWEKADEIHGLDDLPF